MGLGVLLSGLLHLALLVLLVFGPPNWRKTLPEPPKPIPIEIINISDLSVAPPPKKSSDTKPKPEPIKEIKPEPEPEPVSEPVPDPIPTPEPEPAPTPEPAPKSEPEPTPVPESQPEPIPAPKPETKPEPPLKEKSLPPEKPRPPTKKKPEQKKEIEKPKKPKKKKQEKDLFDDVIKALENLEEESSERQPDRGEITDKAQPNEASIIGDTLSISELDALKRQLAGCWSPPNGMKNAETMIVDLSVSINPDGSVRDVKIVDMNRYQSDSLFKPAADAARRAVLNPACNPLKIPLNKYEELKTFVLKFDPREMF